MESQPQVESIARSDLSIANDAEGDKKPIHISVRLIGDRGIGKASIIDAYLGKKSSENEQAAEREQAASTDTAVDQGYTFIAAIYKHGGVTLLKSAIASYSSLMSNLRLCKSKVDNLLKNSEHFNSWL